MCCVSNDTILKSRLLRSPAPQGAESEDEEIDGEPESAMVDRLFELGDLRASSLAGAAMANVVHKVPSRTKRSTNTFTHTHAHT